MIPEESKRDSWQYSENTNILLGTQKKKFQDLDTGEIIEVDQITKRSYGQKAFWKVYLMDFLQVLGILDSRQVDILVYVMEHTEPANNMFLGTYAKIKKDVKVSTSTISKVLNKLQEKGFIKKIQSGAWQVSPNILMKGNDHKKQMLLSYFDDLDPQVLEKAVEDDTRANSESKNG